MTADVSKTPPAKSRTASTAKQKAAAALAALELVRWTPEEVVALRLLPYTSARVLRRKCNRREVYHHGDGGRITFTPEDIRRENERRTVRPFDSAA
ncbi:hypothetical protein AVW11_03785 [Streptomyces amritsarensis]|uniref:Helix-turn-helix domain-containing protein n=1 Tax=Streptomyces amritsarensis TaxID=681158 RepID=A0ABX3GCK5_9ACTN|nr:hypothetical protein [Streptomyces amritsarensis]OLZ72523.1 hypothetical protein AVW11_03785 [Streptomyces amritsarensis]